MLQYQSGEYCICIWDSDKTDLGDAIRSIGQYVNDEKDANEDRQALLELADAVTVCLVAVKELSCTEEELQKKMYKAYRALSCTSEKFQTELEKELDESDSEKEC